MHIPYRNITHMLLTLIGCLSMSVLSAQSMSLEDCIQYALEHQNSIQNARFDEYIAEKRVGEILSTGLPQVEGQASVQNNFSLPVFVLPGPDGGVNEVTFGLPWQATVGASANQLVFATQPSNTAAGDGQPRSLWKYLRKALTELRKK